MLRSTEREFQLLVQGVKDYAIYMLDPQGRITSWNSGAQSIKGYLPDEIIGQDFSKFYTSEDRNAVLPAQALHQARERGRHEAEGWRVRKDGTLFWASTVIDAIHDPTGRLVGFAKVTRDITERRQAEELLEQTRSRLDDVPSEPHRGIHLRVPSVVPRLKSTFREFIRIIEANGFRNVPERTSGSHRQYIRAVGGPTRLVTVAYHNINDEILPSTHRGSVARLGTAPIRQGTIDTIISE
ncbi:MAG: hypothetical protein C5B56_13505 [Proteobacteria bacterium]|nr:MAG: hypothetical protein C5B56_13505 [Pseudomonadota bacterium]